MGSECSVKITGKEVNRHKTTSTKRMSGTKHQNVSTVAKGKKKKRQMGGDRINSLESGEHRSLPVGKVIHSLDPWMDSLKNHSLGCP